MTAFVLASASPRRRELLRRYGFEFDVVPSAVDEAALGLGARGGTLARRLAEAKALDVARLRPDAVVLGADTVVVLRGETLGKPSDATVVRDMLWRLRGAWHEVITAVAIAQPGQVTPSLVEVVTRVEMRNYGDDEIEATIRAGTPFDKAGAYAIQDDAFAPVERYEACYCNVVGLPLAAAVWLLGEAGVTARRATAEKPAACAGCPDWSRRAFYEFP